MAFLASEFHPFLSHDRGWELLRGLGRGLEQGMHRLKALLIGGCDLTTTGCIKVENRVRCALPG